MPLLAAMAIGAGIGALAGLAVYGAKVLISKERTWNWKDAGAHTLGGVVGGGLFPPIMAGLAAVGIPAAGAYVLAGGISWGGIWSLAQDGASWAFGRRDGLASPKKYLVATAIGLAVSALLLPFASRAFNSAQHLKPHAGTPEAFLSTPHGTNLLKAEGEFLAFGALSEAGTAVVRPALARAGSAIARAGGGAMRGGGVDALTPKDLCEDTPLPSSLGIPLPWDEEIRPWDGEITPWDSELGSPFGAWAERARGERRRADSAKEPGAVRALEACWAKRWPTHWISGAR